MKNIALLLVGILAFSCSKDEKNFEEPIAITEVVEEIIVEEDTLFADFTFAEDVVNESDDLNISNLSTGATSYKWDFGDGNIFTEEVPDFKYISHGYYDVTLTISNDKGEEREIVKTIEVLCNFGGGYEHEEPQEF